MYELKGDTAEALFAEACWTFDNNAVQEKTRNGVALSIQGLSVIELSFPRNRVLCNPNRDANPFFHLMETIWMWAGRDDLEWIQQFNKGIAQFAETDGPGTANGTEGYFHGAYGWRWRNCFHVDQLTYLVHQIRNDPNSRRHVLQMWSPEYDLAVKKPPMKDIPCNTQIMFRVLDGALNMTVLNRSNDLIWGALGANIVHMTMLHELMALSTGLGIGVYRVVSNNLHVYARHWELLKGKTEADMCADVFRLPCRALFLGQIDMEEWLADATSFCMEEGVHTESQYSYSWFRTVAAPMKAAYLSKGEKRAKHIERIQCPAWREAANNWNVRRGGRDVSK